MDKASMKIEKKFRQARIISLLYGVIYTILIAFYVGMLLFPITASADNGNTIVHVTATGACYHTENCSYLKSDIPMTLYEAVVEKGYNPCSRCNPPRYDGPEPLHEKMAKSQGGSSSKSSKKAATTASTTVTRTDEEEKDDYVPNAIFVILLVIGGFFVANYIRETYLEIKERRAKEQAEKELFEQEQKKYMELYAYKDPITLVKVPDGSFIRDELPCTDNKSKGIYGDYTVYIAQNRGRVLHIRPSCGSNLKPINYYYVSKRPHCQKCATGYNVNLPKIDWYEDYLKINTIKKKYNIP